MTTNELENIIISHDLGRNTSNETYNQLIKVRDEFAIKFAVWLDRNKKEHKNIVIFETLLEMYKKENPTI